MVPGLCFISLMCIQLVYVNASSKMSICMNWKLERSHLKLICKVNNLKFNVRVTDPSGKEKAHCLPPIASKPLSCFSAERSAIISHNINTSVIELTIPKPADQSMNGFWTCSHGRNKDEAGVEVTIPEPCNQRTAGRECTVTLFLSTMAAFSVASILLKAAVWVCEYFYRKGSIESRIYSFSQSVLRAMTKCSPCIDHDNSRVLSACRKLIVTLLVVYLIIVPIAVGVTEKGTCREREPFYAVGAVVGLMTSLILIEREIVERGENIPHGQLEATGEDIPLGNGSSPEDSNV